MSEPIRETTIATEEIDELLSELTEVLEGNQATHALIALLVLAHQVMEPRLSPLQIQEAVRATSQFMVTLIDSWADVPDGTTNIPDSKLN